MASKNNNKRIREENQLLREQNNLIEKNVKLISSQNNTSTNCSNFTKKISSTVGYEFASWALEKVFNSVFDSLATAIDNYIRRNEIAIQKAKEAKIAITEINSAYQENKKTIEDAIKSYDKLASGVDLSGNSIKNISLSVDDFNEFLRINERLV